MPCEYTIYYSHGIMHDRKRWEPWWDMSKGFRLVR